MAECIIMQLTLHDSLVTSSVLAPKAVQCHKIHFSFPNNNNNHNSTHLMAFFQDNLGMLASEG